jgi:hypothetical protein
MEMENNRFSLSYDCFRANNTGNLFSEHTWTIASLWAARGEDSSKCSFLAASSTSNRLLLCK